MKVKYYEVHDCDFEYVDNISAIIAPEDTDEELLKKYDFVHINGFIIFITITVLNIVAGEQ